MDENIELLLLSLFSYSYGLLSTILKVAMQFLCIQLQAFRALPKLINTILHEGYCRGALQFLGSEYLAYILSVVIHLTSLIFKFTDTQKITTCLQLCLVEIWHS